MNIESQRQLENTRAKLKLLDDRLRELNAQPAANLQTRELTKKSLKKLANQLKEEIIRFESHRATANT
jgi:hypothetical protein